MRISHLKKSYGKHIVLNDISLECNLGQIIGLIGNNGSGKTTLMKCIAHLIVDFQGDILLEDSPSFEIEQPTFYDELSLQDNLKVFAALLGDVDINYTAILKRVGLFNAKDKKYKQLSLGMKQKLSIARMLLSDSKLLLFDEPFNSLDTLTKEQLKALFLFLRSQNKCLLISSHMLEELTEIADVLWYLSDGKIKNIVNLKSKNRVYRVIVAKNIDIRQFLPSHCKVLDHKKERNLSVFKIEVLQEEVSNILKLLIDNKVEVIEYSDSTNDIRELLLKEE